MHHKTSFLTLTHNFWHRKHHDTNAKYQAKRNFLSDYVSLWSIAANVITTSMNKERKKYWKYRRVYAQTVDIDSFPKEHIHLLKRDIITGVFDAWVRSGVYNQGRKIKIGGVTDSLMTVSKTIELTG